MITGLATAVMSLARRCLGENRREWALAMQGEFDAAIADDRPLAFAVGCLIAAWREMPAQGQGRFVLANYALALGLLVPTAGLQFAFVVGLPRSFLGEPARSLFGRCPCVSHTDVAPPLGFARRGAPSHGLGPAGARLVTRDQHRSPDRRGFSDSRHLHECAVAR